MGTLLTLLSTDIAPSGLPTAAADPNQLHNVLQIVFGIVGALAFLMIVVSGLRYILSAGNPDRTSRAKNGIIYALVGVVIAIVGEALVSYVVTNA
jgi:Type IV secretion system pilin/Family of unknown function (DUF6112)